MWRLLIALYPKMWREQYGEEYEALLEETGVSVMTVLNIAKAACMLQLKLYEKSLSILVASALYALSGVACIRLGLTENWPIWAPTSPLKAAGLVMTLMPLVYALYIKFSTLREHVERSQRSGVTFWIVALPFAVVSTLLLAFMCSCLMLSTGLFGINGGPAFAIEALGMAGTSLGLVKLLNALQGQLLRRFVM